jgi:hypothetical protein
VESPLELREVVTVLPGLKVEALSTLAFLKENMKRGVGIKVAV